MSLQWGVISTWGNGFSLVILGGKPSLFTMAQNLAYLEENLVFDGIGPILAPKHHYGENPSLNSV